MLTGQILMQLIVILIVVQVFGFFLLGALMNTRGLVELILLNIALDLNVISPTFFAMLVIMAVVTTVMTPPLLRLLGYQQQHMQAQEAQKTQAPSAAVHES